MTASAHVLVFRPLIDILRGRGDEVEITSREYAQTQQLLALHGLESEVIGHHGGRSSLGKARSLASRLHGLHRFAKGRSFDVALAHGSHELTITARRLGVPSSTTFDYEWATLQHQLGCRAATKVVVPEAIPPERLAKYGAEPPKLLQYPGLKEEYYLADFEPDAGRARRARRRPVARRRRPPAAAGRLALPPALEPAVPADARAPRPRRGRARRRHPAHRGAARPRPLARASVRDRPRARRRRAEPDRALRPRRVGRGHDEPRGGRARRAGLHDVRRPARRGRRVADPRGSAGAADRPAGPRTAEENAERRGRRSRPGARHNSCSTCSSRRAMERDRTLPTRSQFVAEGGCS